MKNKNKKGQAQALLITVPLIIGIVLLVLFLLGGVAAISWITKLFSGFKAIPYWVWIILIVAVFYRMIKR